MTFESIIEAWLECERNKLNSPSCVKFRWHAARDLVELWRQMDGRTYQPRASMTFIVTHPVLREVWAGSFRDRVAHHWEALRFGPVLEAAIVRHGDNSMNCRKGFGSLRAVTTLQEMMEELPDGYIVGGDFASFFMRIDKNLLWGLLEKEMMTHYEGDDLEELLYVMRCSLFHRCQSNYFRRSPASAWDNLPPSKSLFHADGLPIGNLTSQLWANYFGSFFMEWVMGAKGIGRFVLFVDDWRAVVPTAADGRCLLKEAGEWLEEYLHVRLHPNKTYLQQVGKGCRFVGAALKPGRTYASRRTITRFKTVLRRKAEDWATLPKRSNSCLGIEHLRFLDDLRATVNSYLGLLSHHATYRLRRRLCSELILPVWGGYVYFVDEFRVMRLRPHADLLRSVRRSLRSRSFAAKFIRPKWQEQ